MGLPDQLMRLAAAHGVVPDYWGFDGTHRWVTPATLIAVLAALGVDASSPERAEVALSHAEDAPWRQMLPPVVVVRAGADNELVVHVADGDPVTVWADLDPESGGGRRDLDQLDVYVEPRTVDGRQVGRATFAVPTDLPLGWHELHAESPRGSARCQLVVTPARVELPEQLRTGRAWGFMTQLYSVRSRASWGIGDLADLADLAWLAARDCGADFLMVNPLHAAEPVGPMSPSPYRPATRRFMNPVYLRVEDIHETAYLSAADRSLIEWAAESVQPSNTSDGPIDRDAAWAAKRTALDVVFQAPRSRARQAAFDEFRQDQGAGLEDFALWSALCERYQHEDTWPAEALDPSSGLVARARAELADRVTFYCWLQWVADLQLHAAQQAATGGGMSIGIMHDLAVGVHPDGAEAWSQRDVFASGVTVGAPPDMYNQQGQNWNQPPWRPDALARAGYVPYRDMLRTILRHAGAIRIDHVIGLFRLWWIPGGHGADAGAYVRYDHEALIGILCLEAHRAGAVVIGEDLGVFEPWVRGYLEERGILGTSVLWFESEDGGPMPPEHYRRLAMSTVTTHDLPPTAGYLAEEHVAIRERLGLLTEPAALVHKQAREERQALLVRLAERGLISDDPTEREVIEAMHRWIFLTPSVLIGVALVDAVGERRAQNQPGTDREYPNWMVPLADGSGQVVLLDDVFDNARLRSLTAALRG